MSMNLMGGRVEVGVGVGVVVNTSAVVEVSVAPGAGVEAGMRVGVPVDNWITVGSGLGVAVTSSTAHAMPIMVIRESSPTIARHSMDVVPFA